MKILISAYACEPGKGSEPGIGWNLAKHLCAHHKVWVITRANNQPVIERALIDGPIPDLEFVYYDLPRWASWWKRKHRGVRSYYYLWQLGVCSVARKLYDEVEFDIAHHLTFGKYWAPSCLPFLPIPFVWGPVGGGETTPASFKTSFQLGSRGYEMARETMRWFAARDPLVLYTARRSTVGMANTPETAVQLSRLGVRRVELLSHAALSDDDIRDLDNVNPVPGKTRFLSIGRLLHWKGFHLGLKAFAYAALDDSEYWVVGAGPEEARLKQLAESLGLGARVRFFGGLSRSATFDCLKACHALVHPSLHDSAPTVCVEAMAARRPVICIDTGGPGVQVTEQTGFKVGAVSADAAVLGIAEAMQIVAADEDRRIQMGNLARDRVIECFRWRTKASRIADLYRSVA